MPLFLHDKSKVMKRFPLHFLFLALVALAGSCTREQELQPLDLMPYGVPLTILAPDSAVVKKRDMIVQEDITIKAPDGFDVQLYVSNARTTDPKAVKDTLLAQVRRQPYFSRVVREEAQGFIFENQIDSTATFYDFRYVTIRGSKEYQFQGGLLGNFTLEQAERMYYAIQDPKQQ